MEQAILVDRPVGPADEDCRRPRQPLGRSLQGGPVVEPVQYPVNFSVDYPDRDLNRLTTFFRLFTVIPIAIVASLLSQISFTDGNGAYYRPPARWSSCRPS